uniref:Uncharacterized protein LOC105034106 n=1 Tax=Elaeis guineensis var. tenera TaxID=51953 RepID=A0A6I9QDV3_ELAGV|nr:uncharacterized protein LOC105034106 [Elaeis guineensis]
MAVVSNAWGAPQPVRISLAKTPRLSPLSLARRRFSASSQRAPTEGPLLLHAKEVAAPLGNSRKHLKGKVRVFFLDVNPLCYEGAEPSLLSFARWLALFFDEVSLRDPVIAVLDGEEGNEYRRQLLPSYKAHRRRVLRQFLASQSCRGFDSGLSSAERQVMDVLQKCSVPVIKVNGYEADDIVATLTDQVLQKGFRVVIGSPDKDFKQLISEDVQMVMPMPEFGRWSFYTLRHYLAQYKCDPSSDLSLRCFMGDEADGVPGIQHLAPSFGRKTALKLLKRHGSLENLLNAAAIRTVGKDYAQDVLTKYADYLRKNYEVLSLRRDANVQLEEDWLSERDTCNDSAVLSNFIARLGEGQKQDNRLRRKICERRIS